MVYEVIFGYCATVWTIASMTLQQRLVPAELLGRVIAFGRSIMILAIPIGAIGGGLAARWWGLLPTLVGFAIIALVGTTTVTVRIFGRSGGGSPPRYDPATQHRDPAWEHPAPPAQQSSGQHGTTYRECREGRLDVDVRYGSPSPSPGQTK